MSTLWRGLAAAALGVLLGAAPARGQTDADFVLVRDWTPVGTVDFRAVADTLVLTAGTIHSNDAYGDVVLRFEYKLPSARAKAELLVRTQADADGGRREYAIALDGIGSSGQLSATGLPLVETRFRPRAGPGLDWTPCELRVQSGRLSVSVDGAVISEAERIDPADGRLGFRVAAEGIELRGMRVARPPAAPPATPVSFHPELPALGSPGLVPPTLLKQTYPSYPAALRAQGIEGTVRLAVLVTAKGRAGDETVLATSHPALNALARDCVRKWRFRPATKDGVPTGVVVTVEVAFTLER